MRQTQTPQLTLRQTQRQALSQQTRQYLKLLQLPTLALQTELRQLAEQSPFLTYDLPQHTLSYDTLTEKERIQVAESEDADYLNAGREGYGDLADPTAQAEAERRYDYRLASVTAQPSLYQHLLAQLPTVTLPHGVSVDLVEFLCGQLDERGYLRLDKEALLTAWAGLHRGIAGLTEEGLEAAIKTVQQLDPVGIGARSLQECLLLQVQADMRTLPNRALYLRLCRNLAAVEHDSPTQLCRRLQCTAAELHEALHYLRTLNPAPGSAFAPPEPYFVPDILAVRDAEGRWRAVTDTAALPTFRLDEAALASAEALAKERSERSFVAAAKLEAQQILSAFHERNASLQRIAQIIFDRQQAFLEGGCDIAALRPLQQKEVAAAVGYHRSTISRAVKDKMVKIAGKRIPIPLALFFTHAVNAESKTPEAPLSDHKVRAAIKALIADEDKRKPLSDEAIVKQLAAQGMHLARRTVAKYRTQLAIPSTHQRRIGS